MGDIKQANFRLDEEKVAEFRQFCDEQGYNQAQGFEYLMNILALEQSKSVVSNRETEITEFEMHSRALIDAFIRSLETCNHAEARIREDFSGQLVSKDKQIVDYQNRIDKLVEDLETANEFAKETSKVTDEQADKISELRKQIDSLNKNVDTYKVGNDALTASLTIANEKAKSNEEAANNYSSAMRELDKVGKELERSQTFVIQLDEKHKNEIELLNHDHAAEIKQLETQKLLDIREAVETTKTEYQNRIDTMKTQYEERINKINESLSERLDLYQLKIEAANEKMEQLREKMEKEVDKYKKLYEDSIKDNKRNDFKS